VYIVIRLACRWILLTGLLVANSPRAEAVSDVLPPSPVASEAGSESAVPPDSWAQELEQLKERLKSLEAERDQRLAAARDQQAADAKRTTVKWSGQLQADTYWFDQDQSSKATYGDIQNGEAFRRARTAMFGEIGPAEYRLEFDFAQSGRPTFLDVWTGFNDVPYLGKVRAGHFFEPFSLERLTPNRYLTFMERANPDQAFSPVRNLGIAAGNTWAEGHGTWAAGYFRSDSDVFGDDVGDNFENAVTGRVTYLPWFDDATGADYLHLGAGYSFRGTNAELARFRSQPEARVGATGNNVPFFVDTGNIPSDHFQMVGVEAAWVRQFFMIHSEYVLTVVDRIDLPTVYLNGWYVSTSCFLTGEHRPYRKDTGTFDRVIPLRDFLRYARGKQVELGPGAWEVALRVSQVNLNDDTVQGGRLTDFTLGVNWYLTPYSRITSNWVHAFADHPVQGRSGTNIFAVRIGFEF
jgi:phosphate-selective porin OprO/OprP